MCSWQGPNKRPLHDELNILGMEKQTMEENWRKPPETKWVMVQELNPWQVLQMDSLSTVPTTTILTATPRELVAFTSSGCLMPKMPSSCPTRRWVAFLAYSRFLSSTLKISCSMNPWKPRSQRSSTEPPKKPPSPAGLTTWSTWDKWTHHVWCFFSQPINIDKGTTVTDVQNCNRQYKVCSLDKTSESTKLPHSKCTWVF